MPILTLARSIRRLLPALLLTAASAALAQSPYGATVQSLPQPGDPAELLAQALRTLAVEPGNLAALTAAGHNALVLGDPNAAVGFFGRAQEIAPRDGRVKAGLGSALVELEKPQDALRLFAEASRLGMPDDEIAEDRGLAYDLTGDPRRAQRDYATVLAIHPDDDLARRRLALSQGISGDKVAAIATLDPLIRKRDIAGWRAQTFVLAMNGDAKGASDITHIMLPQQADMLQPFLVRLATLSPADKARAVNFGEMPAAGRAYTPTELANTGAAPTYAAPAPASRAAVRPSDLAPVTTQPTVQSRPAARVATSMPSTVAAPATTAQAPLAGTAFAATVPPKPAPPPQVTTQIVPAQPRVTLVATPPPASIPASVAIAQAGPAPSIASGVSAATLPTPAQAGHYDLPHDATAHAATGQTIGTPVVHGKPAPATVATHDTEPAGTKPAAADDATASHPTMTHAVAGEPTADAAPTKHGKSKSSPAPSDETEPASSGRRRAHAKSASADQTDDTTTAKKDRKSAQGKLAATDESADETPAKASKDTHGKSAPSDDEDGGKKSRKGARGTKLAEADQGDESKTSSKSKHGKKTAGDDSDSTSSTSKKGADKAGPGRVFVQVAGGANKDDMDKAWAGVKKKAPELMKGRTPQTTPLHATNRLLVGPFRSEDEAQAFVNKMAGKGLSGFTVKTNKGQKVDKVDSGQ